MFNGLHYNSISSWLKNRFGCRVVKLSLNAGLTCPNRDGTKGTGGCTFCSEDGSGRFAVDINEQILTAKRKWQTEDIRFIAYFQSFTNTYAPAEKLRKLWNDALEQDDVVGLAVATRPDCLGPDILDLLEEFNNRTFLWVELGLQTANEDTADNFNRCWKNADFEKAMKDLSSRGIKCVIHLILGLPGENREQYISSAEYAASFDPFGIKIHMLHLMEGTAMGRQFKTEPFSLLSQQGYVDSVCDILERVPQNITVHRLTGDAPGDTLIAPEWTRNKHSVLNSIQREFKRRGTYQGYLINHAHDHRDL